MTLSDKLIGIIQKYSSTKVVMVSGTLFLLSQVAILSILSPLGLEDVFTLQTTFSKTEFVNIIDKWGEPGLQIYKSHFHLDFFHPFFYSIFLGSLMGKMLSSYRHKRRISYIVLVCLPFFAGLFDLIENTIHLLLLSQVNNISGNLVIISATFCNAKWILVGISNIIICSLVWLLVFRKT